jgi:hypothetical protein
MKIARKSAKLLEQKVPEIDKKTSSVGLNLVPTHCHSSVIFNTFFSTGSARITGIA